MMKTLVHFLFFLIIGCSPKAPVLSSGDIKTGTGNPPLALNLEPVYSKKNFDDIINTYEKVTGVHQSRQRVRYVIENSRAQLPLNNDPSSFSSFNQVAMTSVAYVFCTEFLRDHSRYSSGQLVLFEINTATTLNWKELIADLFIDRLAYTEVSDDPFLVEVKAAMLTAMNQTTVYSSYRSPFTDSSLACTEFLASAYFTME